MEAATDSELMIDDKTKSVGDSMLTINDRRHSSRETTGER